MDHSQNPNYIPNIPDPRDVENKLNQIYFLIFVIFNTIFALVTLVKTFINYFLIKDVKKEICHDRVYNYCPVYQLRGDEEISLEEYRAYCRYVREYREKGIQYYNCRSSCDDNKHSKQCYKYKLEYIRNMELKILNNLNNPQTDLQNDVNDNDVNIDQEIIQTND